MNRNYYKYDFVSVEPLYAKIQLELDSYFATGAVDTILFPVWTDDCLRKLGRAGLPLLPEVLEICDYTTTLPENLVKIREVWACEQSDVVNLRDPSSTYTELSTIMDPVDPAPSRCAPVNCDLPEQMTVIYKTNKTQTIQYNRQWLLRPGNLNTKNYCSDDCFNNVTDNKDYMDYRDTFDVHGNKLLVQFNSGHIFILYYSSSEDANGCQLIPDNYRIEKYIEAYIKYKIFEKLCNQTTDETYNQIERKKMSYKQEAEEAYIMMDIESKKQTVEQKFDSINRTRRRNREYIIR